MNVSQNKNHNHFRSRILNHFFLFFYVACFVAVFFLLRHLSFPFIRCEGRKISFCIFSFDHKIHERATETKERKEHLHTFINEPTLVDLQKKSQETSSFFFNLRIHFFLKIFFSSRLCAWIYDE